MTMSHLTSFIKTGATCSWLIHTYYYVSLFTFEPRVCWVFLVQLVFLEVSLPYFFNCLVWCVSLPLPFNSEMPPSTAFHGIRHYLFCYFFPRDLPSGAAVTLHRLDGSSSAFLSCLGSLAFWIPCLFMGNMLW